MEIYKYYAVRLKSQLGRHLTLYNVILKSMSHRIDIRTMPFWRHMPTGKSAALMMWRLKVHYSIDQANVTSAKFQEKMFQH